MSVASTMTTFDAFLKERYIDKKQLYQLDEYTNNLLKLIPKKTDASGDTWVAAIGQSLPVGDSADYATAIAQSYAGADTKFYGAWKDRFAAVYLQDKVLTMARDEKGAIKKAGDKIEDLRKQFLESTNIQLFRDDGGAIARLGTDTTLTDSQATGSLDATTKTMAQFLKVGMAINLGPNKDGTSLRSGDVYVRSVDPVAGTFTVDASQNSTTAGGGDWPSSTGDTDYVFKDGDATAALCGLEAWVPTTSPTAGATFKNVTRSNDARALAGIRIDASGMTVEEGLIQGVSDARTYGSAADVVFLHPKKVATLTKELAGRSAYQRVKGSGRDFVSGKSTAALGFSALEVETDSGPVMVVADPACQSTLGWVLDMKTWLLWTGEAWPHVRDKDGLKMLRQANENYIFELVGYGECICFAPGKNAVINFGA